VVAEFSSAHFARRNVHRPGEEFTGWKSNPVKEKIASRKDDRDAHNTLRQGRLSLLRQARGGGENESEDPRVTPTRGAPKFMFRTYVWATRPFEGTVGWDVPYQGKGQDIYEAKRNPVSNFEAITPGYFQAVGTPLLSGRDFTFDDKDPNQKVMIVSESLARKAFGNVQRSIGQQISLGRADAPNEKTEWWTIIGIVQDAQYRKLGITQGEIFVPFLQTNVPVRYVAIRTRISAESALPILRQEVAAIDKTLAVSKTRTLGELVGDAKTGPRFTMLLFSVFGVFACFLASVGVYGLVSDSVAQRRREIGIRMALGAQRKTVLRLITQGEMSAILLGGILSLPFVLGMAPVYDRLLYGLQGIDFLSVTVAFMVLCSVSLMSSILPTIRATEVPLSNLLVE